VKIINFQLNIILGLSGQGRSEARIMQGVSGGSKGARGHAPSLQVQKKGNFHEKIVNFREKMWFVPLRKIFQKKF